MLCLGYKIDIKDTRISNLKLEHAVLSGTVHTKYQYSTSILKLVWLTQESGHDPRLAALQLYTLQLV